MGKFDEMSGNTKTSHELAAELSEMHEQAEEAQSNQRVVFTSGGDAFGGELVPSQLRLAQGTTKEVQERRASIGQFVMKNFPPEDNVLLVPLATQLSRTRFALTPSGQQDFKQAPLCVAPTGIHGIGDPGIECAKCPLKEWGPRDPKTGKSSPPLCVAQLNLRAYSVTHEDIIDFQFKGRSFQTGQSIAKQGFMKGFGNFAVEMTSQNQSNAKGAWVEPSIIFQKMDVVSEEDRDRAKRVLALVQEMMVPAGESLQAIEG